VLSLPIETITQRVLVRMLQAALATGAASIHLEPGLGDGGAAVLRHRQGGDLVEIATVDSRLLAPVLAEWKRAAGCGDLGAARLAEGRIDLEHDGASVTVHVEIIPAHRGEALTALVHRSANIFGLDALRLRDEVRDALRQGAQLPYGLLVCSGPTGSGKTTTLFAWLLETVRRDRKAMSLEEPVEYPLPWTTQLQINEEAGLTFDRALRAVMRSDLDVLLIGEIERAEHARAAARVVLTGHLVLSTFHADSAAEALVRIAELSGDRIGMSDLPGLIVGQRLVRRLCAECKVPESLSKEDRALARELAEAGGLPWRALGNDWHRRVGCPTCNQAGYRGRVSFQELLHLETPVRTALQRGAGAEEIQTIAIAEGMTTLAAEAVRLASEGSTSFQEVRRVLGASGPGAA
jgi:type II secretory ATPase GspE/PulE/Tfp pilus assembly ATPase PilB-like protein